MDEVPPGMGPIECRALCRAQADPEYLRAVRERTFKKFSKYPGGIHGPPKIEWHPPPPSNHSGDSATGLPSPSTSENGNQVGPPESIAGRTNNEEALLSAYRLKERVSWSRVTPSQSKKAHSRKSSRMSNTERRKRKIGTRSTRSKTSSTTSSRKLDETDTSNEAGYTAPAASLSGKDSPHLEHKKPVLQTMTRTAPSKPASQSKRKRDGDGGSTRKRARIEPPTSIPDGVLGPAENESETNDTRVENWLHEQESIHKPTISASINNDVESTSSIQQTDKVQETLLSDPKSGQVPKTVTLNQPAGHEIEQSALRMLEDRDHSSRNARSPPSTKSGYGGKVSRKCFSSQICS